MVYYAHLLLIICFFTQVLQVTLNPAFTFSPTSSYIVSNPMEIGLELVPKADSDNSMNYYIVNHTEKPLECSYWRELEIYKNNKWYYFSHLPWVLSSEIISPNSSLYVDDSWITNYCTLTKGKYRIVLNMYFRDQYETEDMFSNPDDCFYLAYEFIVE